MPDPVHVNIRYSIPAQVPPNLAHVADHALAYLRAFARARIPLIATSTAGFSFQDTTSRWFPYRNLFAGRVLDSPFINFCCGFAGDFNRLWTANVPNIMFTGPWWTPTPAELDHMAKWHVVVKDTGDAAACVWKGEIYAYAPTEDEMKRLVSDVWSGRKLNS